MLPPPSPSLVGNLRPGELTPHGDRCHGLVRLRRSVRLSRNYAWSGSSAPLQMSCVRRLWFVGHSGQPGSGLLWLVGLVRVFGFRGRACFGPSGSLAYRFGLLGPSGCSGQPGLRRFACLAFLGQAASWAVGPGGWLGSTVPVGEVKSSSLLALPVMVHWPSWT